MLILSSTIRLSPMLLHGGWELDESIQAAALRETIEEAGVLGTVESELGKWCFKSKGNDAFYEGHMFPLLVKEQLESWPEKDIRQRFWVGFILQKDWIFEFNHSIISLAIQETEEDEETENQKTRMECFIQAHLNQTNEETGPKTALNPDKWIEFKRQEKAKVSHNTQ
ncbi:hypothetical protein L2E82_19728 [Cichorium intybus]|uniref:Uncharacterized protein n=1 Tax=Cichorium intybus TaxID=13427 RepID=A0ACB9FD18_CICIN|nr:hypothetical protein L2E82_19728 [Cichorium intybus]